MLAIFEGLCSIWQYFELTLAKYVVGFMANLNCCKWAYIEEIT